MLSRTLAVLSVTVFIAGCMPLHKENSAMTSNDPRQANKTAVTPGDEHG